MSPLEAQALAPRHALVHDLGPVLEHLARRRVGLRRLERDPLYADARPELERVLSGFDWDLTLAAPPQPPSDGLLRAVAWNIERGKRFEPLLDLVSRDAAFTNADLILLCEVDVGMGRSGNRHVARELAQALGMNYIFANHHLVLCKGDRGEQDHVAPNALALHGSALLTRWPVRRFFSTPLGEHVDKLRAFERRLGCKRALLAELDLPGGPTTVGVVHLDPFCPPRFRVRQMRRVLSAADRLANPRALLGGDLNTNTYNLASAPRFLADLSLKLLSHGVAGTVENYMQPWRIYERRLFEISRRAGFDVFPYNDLRFPTLYYDINSPETATKSQEYMPRPMWEALLRTLEPWGGRVPMRLDWFMGRHLEPVSAGVIDSPGPPGAPISDHNPVLVDLKDPPP